MDSVLQLAVDTIKIDKQALVFVASRASAEKTALDISKLTSFSHPELEEGVLKAIPSPTKQCEKLSKCIRKGIAFHHSGLTNKQKEIIEDEFKTGKIKIICATPTLAAGLSLPVFRVIIKSLKRFSGKWGMDWIPVLEYLQMAGRAGRPEYEKFGESIVVAKSTAERDEIHERYILGEPEEIYSKLAAEPVLRTYLLSLISSGLIRDEKTMKEFFGETFWAHQYGDMEKLTSIMDRMISLLNGWKFIEAGDTSDFVAANTVKDERMRPTPIGRRISELYLDPLTANYLLSCLENFDESKNVFSLLQMISHTLEMRPLLRTKQKEMDFVHNELGKRYEFLLEEEPSSFDMEYGEFVNSIKTALFFEEWISEKGEDFLFETFGARPGEIRAKVESANWLIYSAEELSKVTRNLHAVKELRKLRLRIKHGVHEELLPLLRLKGIGKKRARKMFTNGIKDIGGVKGVDFVTLAQLVGGKVAQSIKEQVGIKVEEVPSGKRKGQLSLGKFNK